MARTREVVENDAYGEMMARCAKAYGRRIAAGDVEDIGKALQVIELFHGQITEGVRKLNDAGESWARIGRGAGISKQAAQQRWGRKAEE